MLKGNNKTKTTRSNAKYRFVSLRCMRPDTNAMHMVVSCEWACSVLSFSLRKSQTKKEEKKLAEWIQTFVAITFSVIITEQKKDIRRVNHCVLHGKISIGKEKKFFYSFCFVTFLLFHLRWIKFDRKFSSEKNKFDGKIIIIS